MVDEVKSLPGNAETQVEPFNTYPDAHFLQVVPSQLVQFEGQLIQLEELVEPVFNVVLPEPHGSQDVFPVYC